MRESPSVPQFQGSSGAISVSRREWRSTSWKIVALEFNGALEPEGFVIVAVVGQGGID